MNTRSLRRANGIRLQSVFLGTKEALATLKTIDRLKKANLRRRVEETLYYLFLILTVGLFLLFIPLHSRFLQKEAEKPVQGQPSEMITHRETNATGERERVVTTAAELLATWIAELPTHE